MPATLTNLRASRIDGASLPPPSVEDVRHCLDDILNETSLCAWSSVTSEVRAHINIGYFAHSSELELYLLSHPASAHCRNIAVNPSMAVAVFASAQEWTQPGRGIQLFGTCSSLDEADAREAEDIYRRRFPAFSAWNAELAPGDPASDYRFYRFTVDRFKLLDEATFGDGVFVEADVLRTQEETPRARTP